ncbi:unnamed protein product [Cuscuta campestris]|uniref:Uncharacterized protein n=1 Tax=Cuscuta campestris TaxID=132261 RepID=A0A484LUU2_9ASTE|nr:unnamed protein product [Cuscuta campestris]
MLSLKLGRRCNGVRRELFFPFFKFLYSTNSTTTGAETAPSFVTEFLTNSLGFSREESTSISAKVTRYSSTTRPVLVLDSLRNIGLDSTQIRNCVSKYPRLLYFDADKNLIPKLECLRELGFSDSDIADILTKGPDILGRGLDSIIKPSIASLRLLFGSDEDLRKTIKSYPWILVANQAMLEIVSYFKEIGLSNKQIRWFLASKPDSLNFQRKWFEEKVSILENDFGIVRGSSLFVYGVYAMARLSKLSIDKKCAIFRSFGWSDSEIIAMFQHQPCYFALSEGNIQKKLDYFMNTLGWKPDYMSTRPVLSYSLEKRVMPRVDVFNALKEKNLGITMPSLYVIIVCSESKFVKTLLLPYKDVLPGMYESYKKIVGR